MSTPDSRNRERIASVAKWRRGMAVRYSNQKSNRSPTMYSDDARPTSEFRKS